MISPAILEHEPPMLLGFSWSEITLLFFPTSGFWLFVAILFAFLSGLKMQGTIMFMIVFYLISETLTMISLAYFYKQARRTKYDGWHLHLIATKFHWSGMFDIVRHPGQWRR